MLLVNCPSVRSACDVNERIVRNLSVLLFVCCSVCMWGLNARNTITTITYSHGNLFI